MAKKPHTVRNAASHALVQPLDQLALPAALNGVAGINRATQRQPQIAATNDLDAVRAWLARFADTRTTFENYRKEAERLLLWSCIELVKPMSSLRHEDLLLYQHFLADPRPAARWIMPAGRKAARDDPRWRPFAGPLSPASQRQATVILNAMFAWLVNAGYLAGNPLSLARQRTRNAPPRITRYLDETIWGEVKQTIETLPRNKARDSEHYERVRWLFSLFYLCGLRLSEITQNTMSGFFCRKDASGDDRWWLEITGKGNKTRIIPATSELMVELARYRRDRGLSAFPLAGETTPLLLPIGGRAQPLSRSAVHLIVKTLFRKTAERLRIGSTEQAARAAQIERASAHWMRHTAGSHMANGQVDLRYVRDNLGHASLDTTSHYLHSEDDARHDATEQRHRIGWREK